MYLGSDLRLLISKLKRHQYDILTEKQVIFKDMAINKCAMWLLGAGCEGKCQEISCNTNKDNLALIYLSIRRSLNCFCLNFSKNTFLMVMHSCLRNASM